MSAHVGQVADAAVHAGDHDRRAVDVHVAHGQHAEVDGDGASASILVVRPALLLAGLGGFLEILRRQAHEQLIAILEIDGGFEAAALEVRPRLYSR